MKKILISALLGLLVTSSALAEQAFYEGKLLRVLQTSDGKYGSCMVGLPIQVNTVLAGCKDSWVTFSCSGNFASKSDASAMMESAKMAYALNKTVLMRVDNTKLHNGYCFSNYVALMD